MPIIIISQSSIPLDGKWFYTSDSNSSLNINKIDRHDSWLEVNVPGSWHLYSKELMDYQGIGWFKKDLYISDFDDDKRYLIKFDAVDYLSELFINKKPVGTHEGGYTNFSFDISDYLSQGENEILLRVNDPQTNEEGTENISYWHIPHGKQSWYVQNSGIWQSVELQIKESIFVEYVQITTKNSGVFTISGLLNSTPEHQKNLSIKIRSPENKDIFEQKIKIVERQFSFEGEIQNPLLWGFDEPNLYTVIANIGNDIYEDRFGFREFIKENGKFYLNGKPFYMISALDQNFYPETIYSSPSKDYIRDEMIKAKELGINTLRCHIKIPERAYLEIADELGLLVWYEIPNWDVFHESVKSRARFTFDRTLQRDWNNPSLVVLSLINESWGIDLTEGDQRKWLLDEFNYAKENAIGRLIVDNSACWGNFHIKSDINDYHIYWAFPENHKKFSEQVREINTRPNWLYSEYGDSEETGDEVLMISEFGNWGLPKLPTQKPFWFSRPFYDDWITLPEGVEDRFYDYKYDRIFENYDALAEESQFVQAKALKFEIEEIRLAENIQGYCVTEFTDLNWEVNGLLDMWRNFKLNKEILQTIQKPDVLISRADKINYTSGERIHIELFFSYYSGEKLSDLKLKWKAMNYDAGEFRINESIQLASVQKLEEVEFSINEIDSPQKIKIDFELHSDSEKIAENFTEIFVYPKTKAAPISDNILITSEIDEEILRQIETGKTVLCLAKNDKAIPEFFPFKIVSREGDWLDGNWASSLNWYSPDHPIFNGLEFQKSFGLEAFNILPGYVISDIPQSQFDAVPSGLFIAWVYLNSGYIAEYKYGNGKILITTFDLSNQTDPYSSNLYSNLITYMNSTAFNPIHELNLTPGK